MSRNNDGNKDDKRNQNREIEQNNNNLEIEDIELAEENDADEVVKKLLEKDNNPDRC